jgi:hypothetical protein
LAFDTTEYNPIPNFDSKENIRACIERTRENISYTPPVLVAFWHTPRQTRVLTLPVTTSMEGSLLEKLTVTHLLKKLSVFY